MLSIVQVQARSQGGGSGGGGGRTTPPVAHPKDFVPPFSNFVPPFSNFVPPFSNFVPPFSNFVPPFSNFVPPLEYVDDVTRAMSKGGGVCAWCSTHPSSDPPTWLAGYGPEVFKYGGIILASLSHVGDAMCHLVCHMQESPW